MGVAVPLLLFGGACPAPSETETRAASRTAGRLPAAAAPADAFGDSDVVHYDLDIEVFPAERRIAGRNAMTVRSLAAGLTTFTFRLHESLAISTATLDGTRPIDVERISATTCRARLDRAYGVGEVFTLTVAYAGVPVSEGFGSLEFARHDGSDVVYTFSCPYYACTWWPCKDGDVGEPGDNSDKATVTLAVTVPEPLRVVANGLLREAQPLPGGRRRYAWATSYPIAPYLVCFAASDYVTWQAEYDYGEGKMPIEFYVYPESDSPETRAQLGTVAELLATFGRLFGPYPFLREKYGIYQFAFGGGMEHQTITGQGSFEENLTAHELAHQWWGDAVTCRDWRHVWLNEGFATYSEALWAEQRAAGEGPAALRAAMVERRPQHLDGSVYCADTSNVDRIFDGDLSYLKGAWVLHQLRHVVGDDAFFRILREYRAAFEGGTATTADFAAVAGRVAGRDLGWFFEQWVYGKGAPDYRYGWQSVELRGQHYLRLHVRQVQDPNGPTFAMPLDVRVDGAAGSERLVIFNDERREHFLLPIHQAARCVVLDESDWVLHVWLAPEPYEPGPPVVVWTDPPPGAVVSAAAAPEQVRVGFSEPIVADAADFALCAADGEAIAFGFDYDADDWTVTLRCAERLAPGSYLLRVDDGVSSAGGVALDGELADPRDPRSLPSGEGRPGGAASIGFRVAGSPGAGNSTPQVPYR